MTTKPRAKRAQRIPRYKDKDGCFIDVFYTSDGTCLAWTDDVDCTEGARCGEGTTGPKSETTAVNRALSAFMKRNRDSVSRGPTGAYYFEGNAVALQAKRLVNAALWNMQNEKPLPDWAKTAVAEGWSPPKGWKP